ncbi:20674_t:CDS:1 [Entrophospora sp. SA101]|nr:15477_t:CDS:1 [Entrophospora sp. SA101]CAJ0765739.1 20674_t:CDS:1 [Entrophospora sp. SA101]
MQIEEVPIVETDITLVEEEEITPMEIDETGEEKDRPQPEQQTSNSSLNPEYKDKVQEYLSVIEEYKDFLPAEVIENLIITLKEYTNTNYWTRKRIYDRWYDKMKRTRKKKINNN